MTTPMTIKSFFDPKTWTVSHVVADPATQHAAIIDPVLDFDFKSGRTRSLHADTIAAYVQEQGLKVQWILETHAHADHLSGAQYLKQKLGGRIAIGEHIKQVQATFKALYNLGQDFQPDGAQFDHLFKDDEVFQIGNIQATALWVPGHTPADMAYAVNGAVFVGDTLFMPDVGTARADFPGGDAHALYRSVQRILALPLQTKVFVCHDYPPSDRAPAWETTIAEQRATNIHIRDGIDESAFVSMRQARDATLAVPELILPSIQVNIRGGRFPEPEGNGVSYLKIPLNKLGSIPQEPSIQT